MLSPRYCPRLPSSGTRSPQNRHPQNRTRGVAGTIMRQTLGFGGGRYLSLVRVWRSSEDLLSSETTFRLSPCPTEGGVCSLLLLSIFQSAFALKYPRDPFPPMSTPIKSFNTSAYSPAASQQSKSKILSPRVQIPRILVCFPCTHVRVFLEVDATEAKTV